MVLRWRRWQCPSSRTATPHGDFQTIRRRPLGSFAWFLFSKFPPGFKLSLFSWFFWVFGGSLSSVGLFLSLPLSLRFFFLFRVPFFSSSYLRSPPPSFIEGQGCETAWVEQGVADQGVTLLASRRPKCMGFSFLAHARREGHRTIKQKFPPMLHVREGRRKGNSVIQNGTVWSFSFFFFFFFLKMYETTSFWRKRAVSFKYGARNAPMFRSAPQLFLFISIASLPMSVPAPIVGRVFHFGPWPLIYAI